MKKSWVKELALLCLCALLLTGTASAALRPGTSPKAAWSQEDLSESGRFVLSRFAD